MPTHFSLGPRVSQVVAVAQSRLLPNRLVELNGPAATAGWGSYSLPAGTQLFQLAGQARPTFCTFVASPKAIQCFVDIDGDGKLDAVAMARSHVPGPFLLIVNQADLAPTTTAIGYTEVAREQCRQRMSIALGYYGRRRMTRHDASFMVTVAAGDALASSPMIPIYLDQPLPPARDVAGVRLVNLALNGKKLEFDVATGFRSGPFSPVYGGSFIERGF